jgi:hypothetical protein
MFVFGLPTKLLGNMGLLVYRWKGLEKYLSNCVFHAPKILKLHSQNKKGQICSRLVTAYQGGQKNRNGETTAVLL